MAEAYIIILQKQKKKMIKKWSDLVHTLNFMLFI